MENEKRDISPKQARLLKNLASRYNTKTAEADQLREQLDAVVLDARNNATFREIAAISNRSVAWVQGSLARSEKRKKCK